MSYDFRTYGLYMQSGRNQETWEVIEKAGQWLIKSANGHIMEAVPVDPKQKKQQKRLLEQNLAHTPYKSAEWEQLLRDTDNAKYYC